jgi:hypothetical protein
MHDCNQTEDNRTGDSETPCQKNLFMNVGPCHHGMARPQVADGGTASDMEGSRE